MGHVSIDPGHRNLDGWDSLAIVSLWMDGLRVARAFLNRYSALSVRRRDDNARSWLMLKIVQPPPRAAHQGQLVAGGDLPGFELSPSWLRLRPRSAFWSGSFGRREDFNSRLAQTSLA